MNRNDKYTHNGIEYTILAVAKFSDGRLKIALGINGVWAKVIKLDVS